MEFMIYWRKTTYGIIINTILRTPEIWIYAKTYRKYVCLFLNVPPLPSTLPAHCGFIAIFIKVENIKATLWHQTLNAMLRSKSRFGNGYKRQCLIVFWTYISSLSMVSVTPSQSWSENLTWKISEIKKNMNFKLCTILSNIMKFHVHPLCSC